MRGSNVFSPAAWQTRASFSMRRRGEHEVGAEVKGERVATDSDPKSDAAGAALFWMASYLSRIAHDPSAEHVWRELLMRFPKGPYAQPARDEYVAALRARKHEEVANHVGARESKP